MIPSIDTPGFREWRVWRLVFQVMPADKTIGAFLTFDAPFVDSVAVAGIDLFWFGLRVELVNNGNAA